MSESIYTEYEHEQLLEALRALDAVAKEAKREGVVIYRSLPSRNSSPQLKVDYDVKSITLDGGFGEH